MASDSERSLSWGPPSAERGQARGLYLWTGQSCRAWGALDLLPGIHCVPRYPGSHWTRWLRIWPGIPVTVRPGPFAARCRLVRCSTCRPCGSTMCSSPTAALRVRSWPSRAAGRWVGVAGSSEGDLCARVSILSTVNYWYDMEYDLKYSYFQLLDSLTKASGLD